MRNPAGIWRHLGASGGICRHLEASGGGGISIQSLSRGLREFRGVRVLNELRAYLALENTAIYRTGATGRSKVLLELRKVT